MQAHYHQFQTGPAIGVPAIRALLLDDSNFDRARIRRLSNKTDLMIELDEVESIAGMESAIRAAAYDLIMIDYRLPVGDGLAALDMIREEPLNSGAGTIMISGNAETDTAVAALRGGCHDFLSKDRMTADRLRQAMTNAIGTAARHRQLALAGTLARNQIRGSVVEAFADPALKQALIAMMSTHLTQPDTPRPGGIWGAMEPEQMAQLVETLYDVDEFVFN